MPGDGQTVAGLSGRERPSSLLLDTQWLVPPPDRRYDDPEEGAWQTARRVPHPLRCFTEPLRLAAPVEEYAVGLTYIKATAETRDVPGGDAFWDAAEHAEASDRWRYLEIETNHMVASNRPEEAHGLVGRHRRRFRLLTSARKWLASRPMEGRRGVARVFWRIITGFADNIAFE